jgi:hypothetical protein
MNEYCTISIDLAPTCDRDRPTEIFISSVCSVTRDMTKILAGLVAILALSGIVCGSITVILHALKAFLSKILAVQIFQRFSAKIVTFRDLSSGGHGDA